MPVCLVEIAQIGAKAAWLDGLQLRLHRVQIGSQSQGGAIAEVKVVGGVDAAQVQVVFHALAQVGEGLGIEARDQKQGGARVKMMTVLDEPVATAACALVFFYHGDLVALLGQPGSDRYAADSGANHHGGCHSRGSFLGLGGWSTEYSDLFTGSVLGKALA